MRGCLRRIGRGMQKLQYVEYSNYSDKTPPVYLVGVRPDERFAIEFDWSFPELWAVPLYTVEGHTVNLLNGSLVNRYEDYLPGNLEMVHLPRTTQVRSTGTHFVFNPRSFNEASLSFEYFGETYPGDLSILSFRTTKERMIEPLFENRDSQSREDPLYDSVIDTPEREIYLHSVKIYRPIEWSRLQKFLKKQKVELPNYKPMASAWGPPVDLSKPYIVPTVHPRLVNDDRTEIRF